MHRRELLASISALAATALATQAGAQSAPAESSQITHVDSKTGGPPLESRVVLASSLSAEGAAPGAKAYVAYNGPTAQLSALASGLVTLEPGSQPHPPHRHIEEEIMIVGEGTGEFILNGTATQVKTGDMIYAESNVLHGVKNTGQSRMTFYFIKMMGRK